MNYKPGYKGGLLIPRVTKTINSDICSRNDLKHKKRIKHECSITTLIKAKESKPMFAGYISTWFPQSH